MSEEQQQQQNSNNQMQQQHKTAKDNCSAHVAPTPSSTNDGASTRKSNIHEMRNQDFVSRLMAATPPYLYSAPVGPNNFFFSDMLRSLVQNRNNENARNLQLQQQSAALARRPRKRSWSQHRPFYESVRERKDMEDKANIRLNNVSSAFNAEKPLELTNKSYFHGNHLKNTKIEDLTCLKQQQHTPNSKNVDIVEKESTFQAEVDTPTQDTPPAASLPPQDLVLPPPVWYPPIYPPYGIDPLHFFIDLRVSGHIYDRKKENLSPLTNAAPNSTTSSNDVSNEADSPIIQKPRMGSAFTVPIPRSNEIKSSTQQSGHAINLSTASPASNTAITKFEHYAKYYDLGESKENQPLCKNSTNYMLQHLPRLYSQFAAQAHITEEADELDSDDRGSTDDRIVTESEDTPQQREGDIDVESRCSSTDEASVTQID